MVKLKLDSLGFFYFSRKEIAKEGKDSRYKDATKKSSAELCEQTINPRYRMRKENIFRTYDASPVCIKTQRI
jgi:hypothetical protein